MIGRVATFTQTLYVLDQSLKTQARLADAQAQTASGLKSQTFGGLGSTSAGSLARLQGEEALATAQGEAATSAGTVLEQSYSALGSISDLTETMLSTLAASIDGDASELSSLAGDWLSDLQSVLNSQYAGQSLFAGEALDATAVDLDAYVSGEADSYYQGSATERVFAGSDGQTVALSVGADDPSIALLVETLKGLVNGTTDASTALDQMQEAASGIGEARATLSSNATRLTAIAERAETRAASLSELTSILRDADLAEAAVLSTQYETLLQTSYSTLNILMSVKLSDYLK